MGILNRDVIEAGHKPKILRRIFLPSAPTPRHNNNLHLLLRGRPLRIPEADRVHPEQTKVISIEK